MKKQILCVCLAVLLGAIPCFAGPKKAARKQKKQRVELLVKNAEEGKVAELKMLLNRKDAEGKRYFSNLVCQDALEAAAKACQLGSVKVLLDPTYEIKYNKTFLSHVLSVAANTSFLKEFEEEYNGVGVTQKSRNKPAEQLAAEQKPCKDVMAYLGNKMQEMDEQAVAKKNKKK